MRQTQLALLERIEPIAEQVLALTLRGTDDALAPWEPGAHIDLSLPNWLTRQYSLCGAPEEHEYRIAVRNERLSRGGSEYIHHFLRPGRTLDISLPRNNFPLVEAPEYLFLAGGIGITALRPMLRAVTAAGKPASLVYIGHSAASMPFAEELRAEYGDRVRVIATEREPRPELTELAAELGPEAHVYCCGPGSMLTAAEEAFDQRRLHIERFRPAPKTFAPNTAFELVCARSGQTIQVPPDESALDTLLHAGYPVNSGCREGVCGSCELVLLDGEAEHRDDIGGPEDRWYSCVSRAHSSRLVVDL